MDLGCLDLGCISLLDDNKTSNSSSTSTSIHVKSKSPKDSPPTGANALTRVASQIKKPQHRKTSPLNWFPRQKGDSYLKRKIKLLQEAGGMYDTLDETLGQANPHYCRVEREKRAAKEAARKVMEARKAAMVEASWCRILQAARIPNKEADTQLLKAEKEVKEAFEAAKSRGVIMYDTPDRPWKDFEIKVSSTNAKGPTTHTIRASFETAFDVDKQVASAVKTALIKLARCNSFDKDEFKDLLKKISENPDSQEILESDNMSEFVIIASCDDGSSSQKRNRKKRSPQKFKGVNLVNMMLERLKCLKEEELASLATIVATCGLNAALANNGSNDYFVNGAREKIVEPELPSLDKFLIKKMTKLEKEVLEAKNARKAESERNGNVKQALVENVPDLGSVLVKNYSKLEKEINEAKASHKSAEIIGRTLKNGKSRHQEKDTEVPSLDKCLVKHVSRLEKEVQEAKNKKNNEDQNQKENINSNTTTSLEIEQKYMKKGDQNGEIESLDKVLVKHVSKLEKAKMEVGSKEVLEVNKRDKELALMGSSVGGLDQILVKHKSRFERERTLPKSEQPEEKNTYSVSRREARERELLQAWGGIGLGNSMRPHVSRLEREKAAWIKAEEEEKQAALNEH